MKKTTAAVMAMALASASGCVTSTHHSPYAGQEARAIKALSNAEVKDLRDGAGMGYAKSAELNRYPGPSHVLELADALQLSPAQRDAIAAILQAHKAEARRLGAEVVALEGELDSLFARGEATSTGIDSLVVRLGETAGRLRGSHLKAHVATTAVLTPAQVDRYVTLRGYGDKP